MATANADPVTEWEDTSSLYSLSRGDRASIAEDTLKKLRMGGYRAPGGAQISFEQEIEFTRKNSVLYAENDLRQLKKLASTAEQSSPTTKIEVVNCTTLQAARSLTAVTDEDSIGVLNFASAKNPGGGFLRGANAQEESLARASSLYLALTEERFTNEFYDYNRRGRSGVYSDRLIYSPRVTVFKNDNGDLLPSPYHVGIVTIPAPNASVIRDANLVRSAMMERVKRLLYAFQAHKHDHLVLGAFGCGVFRNDRRDVARIFHQALLSEEFRGAFKRIVFAVLNPETIQIFQQALNGDSIDEPRVNIPVTADHRQASETQRKSYWKRPKDNRRQRSAVEQADEDVSRENEYP